MSYDLYVYRGDIPDDCVSLVCEDEYSYWSGYETSRGQYFNYTYNLSELFTEFNVNPKRDLDGNTASEVADMIDNALADIREMDMTLLKKLYDPPIVDGRQWGSVESAIRWLKRILDYCRMHPDYKVMERS